MPEFLKLLPPMTALEQWFDALAFQVKSEHIASAEALGRVSAEAVTAAYPLPSFARSTVDGYAVRAVDTHGANESLPAYLSLVGEVPMGASPSFALEAAQCALIHTGGMIPQHANAVVMVEHTQLAGDREIEVMRAAAIGENVLQVGEDVAAGETVIEAGTRFRPAHIGGLMALGITQVCVAERPQVAILSSGDEVIPPGKAIQPGQVRDVNTYSLSALVEKTGGRPRAYGIAPDEFEGMLAAAQTALAQCDMLVITAGSSASQRDLTAAVINALGEPGVMVHGINVRPGKPTILGVCAGKPVVGLPGNPVSALVIAGIFVTAALEALTGIAGTPMRVSKPARLSLNLASQSGREDWVPVRLVSVSGEYLAEPVFGKSNLIFSLARADGLIRIPPDANGLSAGEVVEVFLL